MSGPVTPKTTGRPKNRFTLSPADYKLWYGSKVWQASYEDLLQDGGAVGLSADGMLQLELLPIWGHQGFFYAHLSSADEKVDFAAPMPVRRSDIPALLNVWELNGMQWAEQGMGVPAYRSQVWRFPPQLAVLTKEEMWFVSYEVDGVKGPQLMCRGGWGTYFWNSKPERKLITLLGYDIDSIKKLLLAGPVGRVGFTFPANRATDIVRAALERGADYFHEKLLKAPEGKHFPWLPHAEMLGVKPELMGELKP